MGEAGGAVPATGAGARTKSGTEKEVWKIPGPRPTPDHREL